MKFRSVFLIIILIFLSNSCSKEKEKIYKNIETGNTDIIIGTQSLFQEKVKFLDLGFVAIDEQHKFGVKQRISLAKKGGANCDLLSMSATPIPRTMMLSFFGDMDVSILREKPKNRKNRLRKHNVFSFPIELFKLLSYTFPSLL